MKLDAPQLETVSHAIAHTGELCQITLSNRGGDSISFRLTFRQLSHLIEPLRGVAQEMRKRLTDNHELAKAEMLAAMAEARPVDSIVFATDQHTGDPVLTFEGEELGILSMKLPPKVVGAILTQLAGELSKRPH